MCVITSVMAREIVIGTQGNSAYVDSEVSTNVAFNAHRTDMKRMEIIDSPEGDELRKKCWQITHAIQNGFREQGFDIGEAEACVTPVHIKGGVAQATKMAKDLRENYKVFCSMVIYPVIPKGMIIFRIVSTAAHTMEDVEYTLNAFKEIKAKLDAGLYDGYDIAEMTIK